MSGQDGCIFYVRDNVLIFFETCNCKATFCISVYIPAFPYQLLSTTSMPSTHSPSSAMPLSPSRPINESLEPNLVNFEAAAEIHLTLHKGQSVHSCICFLHLTSKGLSCKVISK